MLGPVFPSHCAMVPRQYLSNTKIDIMLVRAHNKTQYVGCMLISRHLTTLDESLAGALAVTSLRAG